MTKFIEFDGHIFETTNFWVRCHDNYEEFKNSYILSMGNSIISYSKYFDDKNERDTQYNKLKKLLLGNEK